MQISAGILKSSLVIAISGTEELPDYGAPGYSFLKNLICYKLGWKEKNVMLAEVHISLL